MAPDRIVALGEWARVRGFALAGVDTETAENQEAVRSVWAALDHDVAVVILTEAAAAALGESIHDGPLTVVLPP